MHNKIGISMFQKIQILLFLFILASCSSSQQTKKQGGWLSDNEPKINRTKELFACSKFFKMVASQRPSDRVQYEELSKQAESFAFEIMPAYKEGDSSIKSELTLKYNRYGNLKSIEWVKLIGNDKSGELFPKITKDCYKTLKREEFVETVNDLHEKLK